MAMILVLFAGGMRVIGGKLTLSEYVTFSLLVMQLVFPMRFLGYMISVGQRAAAACARIFAILEDTSDIEPLPQLDRRLPKEPRKRGNGRKREKKRKGEETFARKREESERAKSDKEVGGERGGMPR